ncbi:MAG: carboxypeptidase-like regulatory domain-containing protein [Acidobacteriota bacterium]|nr:carboxypeptidase-like regulatory domain-containing protein [Acidobacteriota bacterium]
MLRRITVVFVGLLLLILAASTADAQSALAGVVRDASGGVLPGVTVEAASPALIEQVRSVITDDAGQYRIVDLRPGVYKLTFTLPGFGTVTREKIELISNFTATINGELRVGAV